MKQIACKTIMLVAIATTLLSFTNLGGEGYEICLNNKVIVQQFGASMNSVKNLRLYPHSANDQLTVKYHHCGKIGKNRIITIKNDHNNIVKQWHFADATAPFSAMNCNVKEIIKLSKGDENTFKLYYTSSELPGGRLLITIIVDHNIVARGK